MTKVKGIIKINCIVDSSGGSYHQITLLYSRLQGTFLEIGGIQHKIEIEFFKVPPGSKKIEEFMLETADICAFHWLSENGSGNLSYLCKKYFCKTIWHLDDFLEENCYLTHKMYPTKEVATMMNQLLLLQTTCSDLIVCSTKDIQDRIKPYAEASCIILNTLPYNDSQFEVKENKPSDDGLLRILIIGGSTHIEDYKEYKGIIKKMSNDSYIHNNAKFVIAGPVLGEINQKTGKPLRIWENFIESFKCNSKMKVEVLPVKPVEEYMELFQGDVIWQPLQKNAFNIYKSALKLGEAACRNIPVISSEQYETKELNAYCKAKDGNEVIEWIKYFIKNKNHLEVGRKLGEINRNEHNFNTRLETIKGGIKFVLEKEDIKAPNDLKVWGITYKEDQYTEYQNYDNSKNPYPQRFEYQSFLDIVNNKLGDEEWLGILSWRFPYKTNLSSKLLYRLFEENKNNVDVIGLSPTYWKTGKDYMDFSEHYHPGLTSILELCLNNLGKEYKEPKNIVYSNFFIMKKEKWIKYINDWLKPTIHYMENEIKYLVDQDANYTGGITKEELKKINGLDYFSFQTFVLERLVLQFFMDENLVVKNIL